MPLIRYEPLRTLEHFLDRYRKNFGLNLMNDPDWTAASDWMPRVDISETDKELFISAEIPDVKKEDVKVSLTDGALTIEGEKKQSREESSRKIFRSERYYGKFFRSFLLPEYIDEKKIHAQFKDGILSINIPKTSQPPQKAIEVTLN